MLSSWCVNRSYNVGGQVLIGLIMLVGTRFDDSAFMMLASTDLIQRSTDVKIS